jgi:hypothetical protein
LEDLLDPFNQKTSPMVKKTSLVEDKSPRLMRSSSHGPSHSDFATSIPLEERKLRRSSSTSGPSSVSQLQNLNGLFPSSSFSIQRTPSTSGPDSVKSDPISASGSRFRGVTQSPISKDPFSDLNMVPTRK